MNCRHRPARSLGNPPRSGFRTTLLSSICFLFAFPPLTPMFPLDTSHSPVSPLFPLDTKMVGVGGVSLARPIPISALLSTLSPLPAGRPTVIYTVNYQCRRADIPRSPSRIFLECSFSRQTLQPTRVRLSRVTSPESRRRNYVSWQERRLQRGEASRAKRRGDTEAERQEWRRRGEGGDDRI